MITQGDQLRLFTFISKNLRNDVIAYAFGGTAMMFYGYKDETKDIDLLFETIEERDEFIRVIKDMGYTQTRLTTVYTPEKLKDPHKPVMYKREESRFDLFVTKIFHTQMSPAMKEDKFAAHDFKEEHTLQIIVLRKEHLVLLKAVTERDKDFEDIVTILQKEKSFDWQYFIDEVLWQANNGNSWALYDTQKMLEELQEYVFIEEKYLKQLVK